MNRKWNHRRRHDGVVELHRETQWEAWWRTVTEVAPPVALMLFAVLVVTLAGAWIAALITVWWAR